MTTELISETATDTLETTETPATEATGTVEPKGGNSEFNIYSNIFLLHLQNTSPHHTSISESIYNNNVTTTFTSETTKTTATEPTGYVEPKGGNVEFIIILTSLIFELQTFKINHNQSFPFLIGI